MERHTQSQKKLIQYLEDLRRNEMFIEKLKKLRFLLNNKNKYIDEHIDELEDLAIEQSMNYEIYKQSKESYNKLLYPELNSLISEISKEYKIDYELIYFLASDDILKAKKIELKNIKDFCIIRDNYEQIQLIKDYAYSSIEFDDEHQDETLIHPVSINIHRFASKRDVLDFIEKRWQAIEAILKKYRGEKPIRFRKRKYSQKFRDYLWDSRDKSLPPSEEFEKEYNDHNLSKFDTPKLISLEKKRRSKKLNVGQ